MLRCSKSACDDGAEVLMEADAGGPIDDEERELGFRAVSELSWLVVDGLSSLLSSVSSSPPPLSSDLAPIPEVQLGAQTSDALNIC